MAARPGFQDGNSGGELVLYRVSVARRSPVGHRKQHTDELQTPQKLISKKPAASSDRVKCSRQLQGMPTDQSYSFLASLI